MSVRFVVPEKNIFSFKRKLKLFFNAVGKALFTKKHLTLNEIETALNELRQNSEIEKKALSIVAGFFRPILNTARFFRLSNKSPDQKTKFTSNLIYRGVKSEISSKEFQSFFQKKIRERAALIKSLPFEDAKRILLGIREAALEGAAPGWVLNRAMKEKFKEKFEEFAEAKAALISRTEASALQTDITQMKSIQAGINCYEWLASGGASGDGRTRFSHRKMSGTIVFWDDPPAPETLFPMRRKDGSLIKSSLGKYHAGACPNCRCTAAPVVDVNTFSFPVRVYRNGLIVKMRKKQFLQIIKK